MQKARVYSSAAVQNTLDNINQEELARIESRMALSVRIANRLKELDLSKIQFSKLMDVQPSVITRWLSGTHNFTSDTLTDIQSKLNISLFNTSDTDNIHSYIGKTEEVILLRSGAEVADSKTYSTVSVKNKANYAANLSMDIMSIMETLHESVASYDPCFALQY